MENEVSGILRTRNRESRPSWSLPAQEESNTASSVKWIAVWQGVMVGQ